MICLITLTFTYLSSSSGDPPVFHPGWIEMDPEDREVLAVQVGPVDREGHATDYLKKTKRPKNEAKPKHGILDHL